MLRKAVLILVVFALSGVVPALANWGSCADMPCCHHQVAIDAADGCSGPGTCVIEAKPLPPTHFTAQRSVVSVVLTAAPVETTTPVRRTPPRHASPPLSTAERLSALSILLI